MQEEKTMREKLVEHVVDGGTLKVIAAPKRYDSSEDFGALVALKGRDLELIFNRRADGKFEAMTKDTRAIGVFFNGEDPDFHYDVVVVPA